MGSFYTPDLPYDLNTFTDNLAAYSLSAEAIATLDQVREIIESGKYYFMGVPFPAGQNCLIAGYDTFTGNITVPPLSYIVAFSGDAFYTTGNEERRHKPLRSLEGFKFRLYDKGAKLDTVINSLYAENFPNIGIMANLQNPNLQTNNPIGPMFTQSPMIILAPGSLQVEVTNLSNLSCYIQMLMMLCVPINRQSANEQIMVTGTNFRRNRQ